MARRVISYISSSALTACHIYSNKYDVLSILGLSYSKSKAAKGSTSLSTQLWNRIYGVESFEYCLDMIYIDLRTVDAV